jgi:hypothetical protein
LNAIPPRERQRSDAEADDCIDRSGKWRPMAPRAIRFVRLLAQGCSPGSAKAASADLRADGIARQRASGKRETKACPRWCLAGRGSAASGSCFARHSPQMHVCQAKSASKRRLLSLRTVRIGFERWAATMQGRRRAAKEAPASDRPLLNGSSELPTDAARRARWVSKQNVAGCFSEVASQRD